MALNQRDKAMLAFMKILNRLDNEALFCSDKDIATVLRVFNRASLTSSLEDHIASQNIELAKLKRQLAEALSRCEKKKRYQDRKEAYKAHGASSSVYWCNRHQCWHASKKRSRTNKESDGG